MQRLPTSAELIKNNQAVPEPLRQSVVLLRFAEPIRRSEAGEFLRIQLSSAMRAGGEDDFYQTSIAQPHRAGKQKCSRCGTLMKRMGMRDHRCQNSSCRLDDGRPTMTVSQYAGPLRGVVKIGVAPDFVHHTELYTIADGRTFHIQYIDKVALMLDRRYHENVLAAVYRTAGELCELRGWKLTTKRG